jgi:hypothetical protein
VVDDHKTGSIIKETQKIFLFKEDDLPPSLGKQAKEVNNSTNSILDVKGVGY